MFGSIAASVAEDLQSAYRKDPALRGRCICEIVLYQGLWAVWSHRLAHELWRRNVPLLPRMMSQAARLVTGIEIHPGACVGRRLFIDHGMGVVIGESAEIGDDVMIYHGVTLGAHGWWADGKGTKRHPTIGDRVVLGTGCSVLGPVSVGADARIGAHALVLDDIEPASVVSPTPDTPRQPRAPAASAPWAIERTHHAEYLPQRTGARRPHPPGGAQQIRHRPASQARR